MKRSSIYFCIITAALLMTVTFTDFGFAQAKHAQTQEQAYQVTSIKVKSGMGFEFQAFLKNEVIPIMKKGGVTELQIWQTAFGDPDEYVMLSLLKSMAELDAPGPFAAIGPDGMVVLISRLQRIVASIRSSIIVSRSDLTIAAKPGYVPKVGVLVTNSVAIGREQDFVKSSKAVIDAVGKTNAKGVLSSRLSLGGNPNDFYTLVLFDSYADLDQFGPAFVKAIQEAKLPSETGIVTQRQYEVMRYNSELSIQPVAP
jgi:hypothetical protein